MQSFQKFHDDQYTFMLRLNIIPRSTHNFCHTKTNKKAILSLTNNCMCAIRSGLKSEKRVEKINTEKPWILNGRGLYWKSDLNYVTWKTFDNFYDQTLYKKNNLKYNLKATKRNHCRNCDRNIMCNQQYIVSSNLQNQYWNSCRTFLPKLFLNYVANYTWTVLHILLLDTKCIFQQKMERWYHSRFKLGFLFSFFIWVLVIS